jgi:hypothetical protein
MKVAAVVVATIFIAHIHAQSATFVTQPDMNFDLPPSQGTLGADPEYDGAVLTFSRKMDTYAQRLISKEAKNLAQIDTATIDFDNWYNRVLQQFKIKQNSLDNYSRSDKAQDLAQFERRLGKVKSQFQQRQVGRRARISNLKAQKGFEKTISLLNKAIKQYDIAGQQLNSLKRHEAQYFSKCEQIGGTVPDPSNGQGQLIEFITDTPTDNYQVQITPPDQWDFSSNGCTGPLGTITIADNPDQDSPAYPDPSSQVGVVYSDILDACRDALNDGMTYSDSVNQRVDHLQDKWNSLVVQQQKCLVYLNRIVDQETSLKSRLNDLLNFIESTRSSLYGEPDAAWGSFNNDFENSPPSDSLSSLLYSQ